MTRQDWRQKANERNKTFLSPPCPTHTTPGGTSGQQADGGDMKAEVHVAWVCYCPVQVWDFKPQVIIAHGTPGSGHVQQQQHSQHRRKSTKGGVHCQASKTFFCAQQPVRSQLASLIQVQQTNGSGSVTCAPLHWQACCLNKRCPPVSSRPIAAVAYSTIWACTAAHLNIQAAEEQKRNPKDPDHQLRTNKPQDTQQEEIL